MLISVFPQKRHRSMVYHLYITWYRVNCSTCMLSWCIDQVLKTAHTHTWCTAAMMVSVRQVHTHEVSSCKPGIPVTPPCLLVLLGFGHFSIFPWPSGHVLWLRREASVDRPSREPVDVNVNPNQVRTRKCIINYFHFLNDLNFSI